MITTGNDPVAQRKSVYYEGSSTIYEGMPVCYNFDTTNNWFGSYVSSGTVTESTTTAEAAHNEGKWIRVENPSDSNLEHLAGYVAEGSWCGTTGPRQLDIFIPNGAVIPVRTRANCTVGVTRLYLEGGGQALSSAGQEVGNAVRLVAMAMETDDGSTTPVTILARVYPLGTAPATYDIASGNGPSANLWQDCPWAEMQANPGLGFTYFNDFAENPTLGLGADLSTFDAGGAAITGWKISLANATGSMTNAAEKHGVVKFSSDTTQDDYGIQAQLLSCYVDPAALKTIWFEARVKVATGTDQYFVGLASADTTLIASGALDETNPSYAGFCRDVNTTAAKLEAVCAIGSGGQQANATGDVAITIDTYYNLGFRLTSSAIQYYRNGTLVATRVNTTTASIPTAALALSFVSQSESMTTKDALYCDWVRLAQLR